MSDAELQEELDNRDEVLAVIRDALELLTLELEVANADLVAFAHETNRMLRDIAPDLPPYILERVVAWMVGVPDFIENTRRQHRGVVFAKEDE